jgi:chaperonin GroES
MKPKLIPKFDRLLVEREKLVTKSSLIIIPEDSAKKFAPTVGVITAIGPACEEDWYVGEKVLFGKHAGTWVEYEGTELYLLAEADVLCEVAE